MKIMTMILLDAAACYVICFWSYLYFYEEELGADSKHIPHSVDNGPRKPVPCCIITLRNVTTCHHLIPLVNDQVITFLEAQTLLLTDIEYAS